MLIKHFGLTGTGLRPCSQAFLASDSMAVYKLSMGMIPGPR